MRERLQKVLARAGLASRRAAEDLIRSGRVSLNGTPVTAMGILADPEIDQILLDGKPVRIESRHRVLALNKPKGYVCSSRIAREHGRSILELVPDDRRYFTVGRLDRDSSGLLLVTDDGDLAFRLTHPRHGTQKVYVVETSRPLRREEIDRLKLGLLLEDGVARAVQARRLADGRTVVVLTEGRKRQIRRMMAVLGTRVRELHRTQIGTLKLGKLKPGEWRELTEAEVRTL